MNDLVSIVIPIYNMGASIEECVKSVCSQTYGNIEIILVDDGSADNSLEVCNKLADNDERICVYHTENRGSGPARNTGIQNAHGKYIYFPDADDYLDEHAIEILAGKMDSGGYDLVVFGFKNVGADGKVLSEKTYSDCVMDGNAVRSDYYDFMTITSKYGIQGAPWNKFFRTSVIKEHGVEYPPLRRHQDEGFIARYVSHIKDVCFISDVLYTYYTNDLKKEWDKYPTDYIDAVIGLHETRKDTILSWNKNDTKAHERIACEYICGVIKSLELSFSSKMKLNKKERFEWIKQAIAKSKIENYALPASVDMQYQKKVMKLITQKKINSLYMLLHFKVLIQKNSTGLFDLIHGGLSRNNK